MSTTAKKFVINQNYLLNNKIKCNRANCLFAHWVKPLLELSLCVDARYSHLTLGFDSKHTFFSKISDSLTNKQTPEGSIGRILGIFLFYLLISVTHNIGESGTAALKVWKMNRTFTVRQCDRSGWMPFISVAAFPSRSECLSPEHWQGFHSPNWFSGWQGSHTHTLTQRYT